MTDMNSLDELRRELRALQRPSDLGEWTTRALHFASLRRFGEALEIYKKIAEVDNSHPEIVFNHALVLDRMNRCEEAEKRYKEALALDPLDPEIKNNLALLLHRSGRIGEAQRLYEQALQTSPNVDVLHVGYGDLLRSQGRASEAVAEYNAALRINPSCSTAHRRLADELFIKGHQTEAADHYKALLHGKPGLRRLLWIRIGVLLGAASVAAGLVLWIIGPSMRAACLLFVPVVAACFVLLVSLAAVLRWMAAGIRHRGSND